MILDRYIGNYIGKLSCISLFVLIAIFVFFSLVEELGDIGKGNYGIGDAILYVFLTIPRLSIELLPIAIVIGSMSALGILANNNELAVIRTSWVSRTKLASFTLKISLIFIIISTLIGEFVVPKSEYIAQQKRSLAVTKQVVLKTENGFWSKNTNTYVNIKKILSSLKLEDVYIYDFNDNYYLKTKIYAHSAEYKHNGWILHDVYITNISAKKITVKHLEKTGNYNLLEPKVLEIAASKPKYLSLYELINYIKHLENNNQSSQLYKQTFWGKIITPFSIIAMVLLSVCLVKCEARGVGIGQRVFVGTLIGVVFNFSNQIFDHMGTIYGAPAFISASLPTIILFVYIYYVLAMQKQN